MCKRKTQRLNRKVWFWNAVSKAQKGKRGKDKSSKHNTNTSSTRCHSTVKGQTYSDPLYAADNKQGQASDMLSNISAPKKPSKEEEVRLQR